MSGLREKWRALDREYARAFPMGRGERALRIAVGVLLAIVGITEAVLFAAMTGYL